MHFFKIRRLYYLFIRAYLGPLVLTFFIAVFVLLMQFLWKYVDDFVGKGLDMLILAKLLFYASVTFVPMALPLSILLSSLMTFGNFGEHYELAAAKSVGISLRKMMFPLTVIAIVFAAVAFLFSNNILPYANLKMRSMLYDVTNAKPALNIREGIFYNEIDNIVLKIGKKESDGRSIKNIMIYDHTKFSGNTSVTIAESGTMDMTDNKHYLILKLNNGYSYNEPLEKREQYTSRPLEKFQFKEQIKRLDLSSFSMQRTNEDFFKSHYQMMNIRQLSFSMDSLRKYITEKKDGFVSQLTSYWYYYTNKVHADELNTDLPADSISKVPLLAGYNVKDRTEIFSLAIQSAKNMKEIAGYQVLEIEELNKNLNRYKIEFHRKFTLSVACIILFFIGAPLGAIIRKGGLGLPLVIATLVFVFYYILSITGEKFVREGVWNPLFGMWLSTIILLPFGAWLTYKTTTDSPLMDYDMYSNTIKKFLKLISRNVNS